MITIHLKGKYADGSYRIIHNGKETRMSDFNCISAFLQGLFLGEVKT